MEDAEAAVLAYAGHVHAVGGEGKLVQAALADHPAQQRVTGRLGFAGVDGESFSLPEQTVLRGRGAARVLDVVEVEVTAGMRCQEQILRFGKPFQTCDLGFVYQPLRKRKDTRESVEFVSSELISDCNTTCKCWLSSNHSTAQCKK